MIELLFAATSPLGWRRSRASLGGMYFDNNQAVATNKAAWPIITCLVSIRLFSVAIFRVNRRKCRQHTFKVFANWRSQRER